jgi:hypothetical protein
MIKKTLLLLLLPAALVGIVSCLGEGENQSSASSIAVIDFRPEMGGYVMNLPTVVLAAPELAPKVENGELKVNDCVLVDFTINYSKQPSAEYYTATEISYQRLNNTPVKVIAGEMMDDYNESISRIALNTSPFYNGNVFIQIDRGETNNQVYNFELILNTDSIDENEVPSVFLKSQKTDKAIGAQTNSALETFNLQSLFATYGRDSVYREGNVEQHYRCVYLKFMYQSGTNDGVPVYSLYGGKSEYISVFKNN